MHLCLLVLAAALAQTPREEGVDPLWDACATAPGADSRNNVWHSIFNVPPFEEAKVLPTGILAARMWTDVSLGNFLAANEGGRTIWKNEIVEELLQADYGISPRWQAGLRVSAGWPLERKDLPVQVFDRGELVTEHIDRDFDLVGAVLRVKYAESWTDYFDWGLLVEMKIPGARKQNLMTAQTFDLGVSLLGTRQLAEKMWMHVNVGVVAPMGSTEFFVRDDDPNVFFTLGVGATWRLLPQASVFVQGEGNSSAFHQFKEIDRPVGTLSGGARVSLGRGFSVDASAGGGFNEWSSEWFATVGVNFAARMP